MCASRDKIILKGSKKGKVVVIAEFCKRLCPPLGFLILAIVFVLCVFSRKYSGTRAQQIPFLFWDDVHRKGLIIPCHWQ